MKFDEPAIVEALRRGCRYVGAVGSRKTQADRRTRLLEAGVDRGRAGPAARARRARPRRPRAGRDRPRDPGRDRRRALRRLGPPDEGARGRLAGLPVRLRGGGRGRGDRPCRESQQHPGDDHQRDTDRDEEDRQEVADPERESRPPLLQQPVPVAECDDRPHGAERDAGPGRDCGQPATGQEGDEGSQCHHGEHDHGRAHVPVTREVEGPADEHERDASEGEPRGHGRRTHSGPDLRSAPAGADEQCHRGDREGDRGHGAECVEVIEVEECLDHASDGEHRQDDAGEKTDDGSRH